MELATCAFFFIIFYDVVIFPHGSGHSGAQNKYIKNAAVWKIDPSTDAAPDLSPLGKYHKILMPGDSSPTPRPHRFLPSYWQQQSVKIKIHKARLTAC